MSIDKNKIVLQYASELKTNFIFKDSFNTLKLVYSDSFDKLKLVISSFVALVAIQINETVGYTSVISGVLNKVLRINNISKYTSSVIAKLNKKINIITLSEYRSAVLATIVSNIRINFLGNYKIGQSKSLFELDDLALGDIDNLTLGDLGTTGGIRADLIKKATINNISSLTTTIELTLLKFVKLSTYDPQTLGDMDNLTLGELDRNEV